MTLSNGTGTIQAPANGKLLITASGNFQKLNAAGLSDVDCSIALKTGGGAFQEISQGVIREFQTQFENEGLSVTAGASVTAGTTYDVALSCESFNPEVKFVRGDMTAVFVGG